MNQKEPIPRPEETLDLDMDTMSSVENFIKELEAKEKDLHITADLTIEIEESEYDPRNVPDTILDEPGDAPAAAQASQPSAGAKTRIYELEQEIGDLKERIAGLRADRNEVQEKSDRRLKDFENYKYRMDRERRGAFIDQISNLASQMLPVLDNFDRALDAADKLEATKSPEFQQFYDGIVLVHQQVNEVISGMGVEPIKTVGDVFDPNFHEAVSAEARTDVPANTILEEMLRGYRIGNRVIRHSMVKVTSSPAAPRKELKPSQTGPVDLNPEDNGVPAEPAADAGPDDSLDLSL